VFAGYTEICESNIAVLFEDDVFGFEVSVDDVTGMDVL
jgi:hypothetical protein